MYKFMRNLQLELRLYRRGFWLWIVICMLTIYLTQGYYIFVKENLSTGQLLQSSSYIVMAGMLLGMVSGVINSKRSRVVSFEEVESSFPGYEWIPIAKLMAWGVIVTFLMLVSIGEILFMFWLSKTQMLYFWPQTIEYILLYWGATTLSGGCLGYAIERLIQSKWTYLVVFPVWILTSPYNSIFLPKQVAYWLNQGEFDPNQFYNDYSGLGVSIDVMFRHVFLFFIAIALLVVSILFRQVRESSRTTKKWLYIGCFLVLLLVCSIVILRGEHTNSTSVEQSVQDFQFYHDFENKHPTEEVYNKAPSFKVTSYRVNLTPQIDNEIDYTTNIVIEPFTKVSDQQVDFTLYHQLKILDLKVNGKSAIWNRDGDLLQIQTKGSQDDISVTIHIRGGVGPNNLVTNNSLFLSSSSPWYPIPGKWRVAEGTPNGTLRFIQIIPTYSIPFQIKVEGEEGDIYSNLSEKGKNQFEGATKGATLMKGNLFEKTVQNTRIVAPPDLIEKIPALLPKLQSSMNEVGDRLKTKVPTIPSNVFVVPMATDSSLDAMIMLPDQLQLDVSNARRVYLKEEDLFANPLLVLNACFWYPEHKEQQSVSAFLLDTFYEYLYVQQPPNRKSFLEMMATDQVDPSMGEMQTIAKQIVDLKQHNKASGLQSVLSTWFAELKQNDAPIESLGNLLGKVK